MKIHIQLNGQIRISKVIFPNHKTSRCNHQWAPQKTMNSKGFGKLKIGVFTILTNL